jgi:hypothetical protein
LACIPATRDHDPTGARPWAPPFGGASCGIAASSLLDTAAALPHAPGSPRLGVLRRLRPAPGRSADDVLSPHHHAGHAAGGQVRDGSRVHCDSLTEGGARLCPSGLAASTPQTFPAASQSPASRLLGVPHQVGARRSRPRSVRFEPVRALRGFMTPVPRVLLSGLLTGPTPSDGAGAPRLCQDCSHQPRRLPGPAVLSSCRAAATAQRRWSLTSTRINSASRRTKQALQAFTIYFEGRIPTP